MGRRRRRSPASDEAARSDGGFLLSLELEREKVPSFDAYPFSVPAVMGLTSLDFHRHVTFLVGENGAGKSTLIEAIAVAAGFNPEGGSKNFSFATRASHSPLEQYLTLSRGMRRERDGFFLRAESFFNVATEIERLDAEPALDESPLIEAFGGRSLHEQSHGESFLALAKNRFFGNGLYILDEPEAALSPQRQLSFLALLDEHVRRRGSQFVIATHSPIIMGYPDALIYLLGRDGIAPVAYEDTEHFQITRGFLANREEVFRTLFRDDSGEA